MADVDKVAQAEKLFKSAEKHAKKSLFHKPDWDQASTEFEQAAQHFRNAKSFDRAIDAFVKAADANEQINLMWAAGKALENAAMIAKDLNRMEESTKFFISSARKYRMDGKVDKAAEVLRKAARLMETSNIGSAIEMLQDCCEFLMDDEKWHLAAEPFRSLIQMLVRADRYEEAADAYVTQMKAFLKLDQPHNIARNILGAVICCLTAGNVAKADATMRQASESYMKVMSSDEYTLCDNLIRAFNEGDEQTLADLVKYQSITFLDNEVARLGKNLKIKEGMKKSEAYTALAPELDPDNLL